MALSRISPMQQPVLFAQSTQKTDAPPAITKNPASTAVSQQPAVLFGKNPVVTTGEHKLSQLLGTYELAPKTTRLAYSGKTLEAFLNDFDIDLATQTLKIDPSESLDNRLTRWGFPKEGNITVEGKEAFKNLLLATFETYFTQHRAGLPPERIVGLMPAIDRFANQMFRIVLGHDLYNKSLTTGQAKGVADGSVFFEAAFAPGATGNADLLKSRDTFLGLLDSLRLEAEDGRLDGKELRVLSANFLDGAMETDYAPAVQKFSPDNSAVISQDTLRGDFLGKNDQFTDPGFEELGRRSGVSYPTFVRANTVFHAFAMGGPDIARESIVPGPRNLVTVWNLAEAAGAQSPVPLLPIRNVFGFISQKLSPGVKIQMAKDLVKSTVTLQDVALWGDKKSGGMAGPGSFLDTVFFDHFGVNSKDLRNQGHLKKSKPEGGIGHLIGESVLFPTRVAALGLDLTRKVFFPWL